MSKKNDLNKQRTCIRRLLARIRDEFHGGLSLYAGKLVAEQGERYFANAPAGYRAPTISSAQATIERAGDWLVIRVFADIDYHVLVASKRSETRFLLPGFNDGVPEDVKYHIFAQAVEKRITEAVDCIFDNIPFCYESATPGDQDFQRHFSSVAYKNGKSMIEGVSLSALRNGALDRTKDMLKQRLMDRISASFERRRKDILKVYPGHFLGTVTDCSFAYNTSNTRDCILNVSISTEYERLYTWTIQVSSYILRAFQYTSAQDVQEYIEKVLLQLADKAADLVADSIPVCHVVIGDEKGMFPSFLFEYFISGSARIGCVTLTMEDRKKDTGMKDPFLSYIGGKKYEILPGKTICPGKAQGLELDLAAISRSLDSTFSLGRHREPPESIDIFRYCASVSSLCKTLSDAKKIPCPELEFTMTDGVLTSAKYRDHKYSKRELFGDGSMTLKDAILPILRSTIEEEAHLVDLGEAQLAVLNTLNPTELAILRHAHSKGRTWFHDAADAVEYKTITTKTFAGDCLSNLCEVEVPTDSGRHLLLDWEWKRSRKHGDFKLYMPVATLVPDILDKVKPREYRPDEIPNIEAKHRGVWFAKLAARAQTAEERWEALRILENDMPKTYLPEFAKSPEGQAFFSAFEGADATYVQFLLQNTPGCKKLAAAIFDPARTSDT